MMRRGATPFPKTPDSDLPSILKALYLQQRFQDFAITAQGKGDAALLSAFKDFLDEHKPGDPELTQEPGTVRA